MASQRDTKAAGAHVEINLRDRYSKQLRQISRRMGAFGSSALRIGSRLAGVGLSAAGLFIPAIKAASDLEEVINKFNVVFGGNAAAVKAWGDEYALQVGRSKRQIAEFLANTQDLFIPLGFDAAAAEEMSKKVTTLAVDVASFNNKLDADVLRDFHSALTGGGETVKKYGVVLDQAGTKLELLRMGLDPKEATNAQKAQARLNILLQGTTAAQGDAIRSAGSFANSLKGLRGSLEDTAAAIGKDLLPVITPWITVARTAAMQAAEWIGENKGLVEAIFQTGLAVAAAGAALMAFGTIFVGLSASVAAFSAVIGVLTTPVGLGLAGIAAGVAAFVEWDRVIASAQNTLSELSDAIKSGGMAGAMKLLGMQMEHEWIKFINSWKISYIEFERWWILRAGVLLQPLIASADAGIDMQVDKLDEEIRAGQREINTLQMELAKVPEKTAEKAKQAAKQVKQDVSKISPVGFAGDTNTAATLRSAEGMHAIANALRGARSADPMDKVAESAAETAANTAETARNTRKQNRVATPPPGAGRLASTF